MALANLVEMKFDNGEFFAGHTADGGFRVGMNGLCAIQYPADHADIDSVKALTLATVEEFIDGQVAKGNIRF